MMRKRRRRTTQLDLSVQFIAQARRLPPETQQGLLESMQAHQPKQDRVFWLILPTGGKIKL